MAIMVQTLNTMFSQRTIIDGDKKGAGANEFAVETHYSCCIFDVFHSIYGPDKHLDGPSIYV